MLTGDWILMIDDPPQDIVFTLREILLPGAQKQQVLSHSTAKAEYRGLAATTTDITWLVSLLRELKFEFVDIPTIWCDNSSALAVVANLVLHSKFKHVKLDLFFFHEKVVDGSLIVGEVPTCDQVADTLTKPFSASQFCRLRHLLQVSKVAKLGEC
ncbi:hypothetical protein V6Z12_D04G120700 [Gossypium hirsutum]